jgi:hypothetical protein
MALKRLKVHRQMRKLKRRAGRAELNERKSIANKKVKNLSLTLSRNIQWYRVQ